MMKALILKADSVVQEIDLEGKFMFILNDLTDDVYYTDGSAKKLFVGKVKDSMFGSSHLRTLEKYLARMK